MKESTRNILTELTLRYPALCGLQADIEAAFCALKACYEGGGRVYLCGNGGSTSDCEHIVGELMKSFRKIRALPEGIAEGLAAYGEEGVRVANGLEGGLPAVALTSHLSLSTAFAKAGAKLVITGRTESTLLAAKEKLEAIASSGSST